MILGHGWQRTLKSQQNKYLTWLEDLNQEVLNNSSCNHFVEAGSVIRYPCWKFSIVCSSSRTTDSWFYVGGYFVRTKTRNILKTNLADQPHVKWGNWNIHLASAPFHPPLPESIFDRRGNCVIPIWSFWTLYHGIFWEEFLDSIRDLCSWSVLDFLKSRFVWY